MASFSVGKLTTAGCDYNCYIDYSSIARSGTTVMIYGVKARIVSASQYQTLNRIAVNCSIGGASRASNKTVLPAYDTDYPSSVTVTIGDFTIQNNPQNTLSISAEFRSTGYGSDWNNDQGHVSNSGNLTAPTLTYTVSFDANGGSGAPSAQTKNYGTNLTLSSTVPTRNNYEFLGWATSKARADAGTTDYQPGGTYSTEANATLYAAWKRKGSVRVNIGGTWKQGIPYVNVGGSWKKGVAYVNVGGSWKIGT